MVYSVLAEQDTAMFDTDTLIVGAGVTGLTAAYSLREGGYGGTITILEKSGRVGGRIESAVFSNHSGTLEFGAGRFLPERHVMLDELRLKLDIAIETFNYPARYGGCKTHQPGNGDSLEYIRLLDVLKRVPDAKDGHTFIDCTESLLSTEEFAFLVSHSGYDTLSNPALPLEAGITILEDHPEGHSYLTSTTEGWCRLAGGFENLTRELERRVRTTSTLYCNSDVRTCHLLPNQSARRYSASVIRDGRLETVGCDSIIMTTPITTSKALLYAGGWHSSLFLEEFEQIPLIKGFMLFSRRWWDECGFAPGCVINNSILRKVYLPDEGNVVWFYCDGQSARLVYRFLKEEPQRICELLETHIEAQLPKDTSVEQFEWRFWPAGIIFPHGHDREHDAFLELDRGLLICSDIFTDHLGWIEGGICSGRAAADRVLSQQVTPNLQTVSSDARTHHPNR